MNLLIFLFDHDVIFFTIFKTVSSVTQKIVEYDVDSC